MPPDNSYCPYDIVAEPAVFGLHEEYLASAFGNMHVVRSERRHSTVTLFLHGVGGTWASWTPLLQAAQSSTDLGDILLIDLPGFGQSENRLGHLRAEVVGTELVRLIQAMGWRDIRLVGHSMGGFLALDMAAHAPATVSSVSVIAGTYLSIVAGVQHPLRTFIHAPRTSLAYFIMVLAASLGPISNWLLNKIKDSQLFLVLLSTTFAHPKKLKQTVIHAIALNARPRAFLLAAQNGKGYQPEQEWAKITIPLRALFGDMDALVPPADRYRLKKSVPHLRATHLPDIAHFAHIERPHDTLRWLQAER